jgi:DNA (cytosine-5)-methyltransferase 1|uniref:Cytosine-specific methyltransferase n=1 Tax=uncultured Caudovirales phage TaxID=2100421 RepID=A0A6J5KYR1_9CAUD|nr:Dcm Site-specific DNA methylase [uncultured Caudovirales phage]
MDLSGKLNGLSLFSGIGGIDLALDEWVKPIAYCEINSYCQGVLLSRMADKSLSDGPIWDDIKTFAGNIFKGTIDIIYGGFPCQDISVAGNGKGLAGERSGLFFEIVRLVKEIQPKFIFIENSSAINTRGGNRVIESLTSIGYSCRWITKTAEEEGSPQIRKRWFCLAYSNGKSGIETYKGTKSEQKEGKTRIRSSRQDRGMFPESYWKKNQSPILGMDDGIPYRVDRAFALGNSVCIIQCKEAFKELIGL